MPKSSQVVPGVGLLLGFLLVALTACAGAPGGSPTHSVALTNVYLIDGTGSAPRAGVTVLVADGRVREVFDAGARELPEGTEVHDLSGRWVVPGLINTHVHFMQLGRAEGGGRAFDREAVLAELERSLRAGVTTVREAVAGDILATAEVARTAAAGTAPLPDVRYAQLVAGPTFFASDPRVRNAPADDPRLRGAVRGRADLAGVVEWADSVGASAIKIYSDLDPGLVRDAAAAARVGGLGAWAHATVFPTRPSEVVAAGVGSISHVCGLPWEVLSSVPAGLGERPRFDPADVEPADPRFAALFEEMHRRGTVLDATMSVYTRPSTHERGCVPELMVPLARAAHEAGVPLSTGTDYFNGPDEPHPSLHTEIVYLVESGVMDAGEAIVAATLNGARALGIEDTHGTLEPGKAADLVILAANPLADIRALYGVVGVMKGGRLYWRRDSGTP